MIRPRETSAERSPWWLVALAWMAVGAPLLWGVLTTVAKASALFAR